MEQDAIKYGRLTLIRVLRERTKAGKPMWLCKCDCGNISKYVRADLKSGHTKSCGCLKVELSTARLTKHGLKGTLEYSAWNAMKNRCYQKNIINYKNYGGRGIKVCNRWRNSFENFINDMGKKQKGYSLDRIDNNKGYFPANCRWVSRQQSCWNRRVTRWMTVNGVTAPITHLAKTVAKVCQETIRNRLRKGWNVEDAFLIPVLNGRGRKAHHAKA